MKSYRQGVSGWMELESKAMTNDKKAILALTSTVKRLERELAEARKVSGARQDRWAVAQSRLAEIEGMLFGLHATGPVSCGIVESIEEIRRDLTTYKSDAEALRALASWVHQNPILRVVSDISMDNPGKWRVVLVTARPDTDGTGPTLAAAIMDALGKVQESTR
tara:strand:- start:355 stop:846 length:492 start_codon:yes stop_codon:yes gene_type:complete